MSEATKERLIKEIAGNYRNNSVVMFMALWCVHENRMG